MVITESFIKQHIGGNINKAEIAMMEMIKELKLGNPSEARLCKIEMERHLIAANKLSDSFVIPD